MNSQGVPQFETAGIVRDATTVIEKPSTGTHTATVIMLHGAASSGADFRAWIHARLGRPLRFDHVKLIYPTAKEQRCALAMGAERNVWFDLESISPEAAEDTEGIGHRCVELDRMIEKETRRGIPANRIAVVGFSMGGVLAMHIGLGKRQDIAGVGVLSAFLNLKSAVYDALGEGAGAAPPCLFWGHGATDMVVRCRWGKKTFDRLLALRVKGEFKTYDGLEHYMSPGELIDLENWLTNLFK